MTPADDEKRDRRKTRHIDMPLGRKLRLARDASGLTQAGLADRLDVSPATIQKYEQGDVRVPASRLWQMCRILKLEVAEIYAALPHNVLSDVVDVGVRETGTAFVDDSGRERRIRAITRAAAKLTDERLEAAEIVVKALKPRPRQGLIV